MPGRDRTGPSGAGSKSGRGMGRCNDNDQPNAANQAATRRGRFGFGGGGGGVGRGWRHRFFATGVPGWAVGKQTQDSTDLQNQADLLKAQLDALQERIDELAAK